MSRFQFRMDGRVYRAPGIAAGDAMKISVNLFATLSRFRPDDEKSGPWEMECPEGMTVGQLLELLKIPPFKARIIFVNNIHAAETTILQPGDRVGVFPPVGGG